jgi:hypothetical protein
VNDKQKKEDDMKGFIALCLVLLLGAMPAFSMSHSESVPPGNWAKVESLAQNEEISVKMLFGDTMQGKYLGLDPDAIRINIEGQERMYPKKDVAEIRLTGIRDSNNNGSLIGLAIGAGASTALLAAGNAESKYYAISVPIWAGIGALIGYVADNLHKGSELIYRAPSND